MTELEFQELASQGYTRIPVLAEARADLYTPLALYAQLANGPYSYLLESVVGGERFGRYSFIGLACSERCGNRRRAAHGAAAACATRAAPTSASRGWTTPIPTPTCATGCSATRPRRCLRRLRFGGGLVGLFRL